MASFPKSGPYAQQKGLCGQGQGQYPNAGGVLQTGKPSNPAPAYNTFGTNQPYATNQTDPGQRTTYIINGTATNPTPAGYWANDGKFYYYPRQS